MAIVFPPIFKGVRVLDFSRLLPGPFASDLLIRFGAEVTCVLPPNGDPLLGAYSPFKKIHAGKKFLTFDLKDPAALREVLDLAAESQILLEGFRPGTMDRLGLGFGEIVTRQPQILYVSMIGYAEGHARFYQGAHDINFLIDSGVYSLLQGDDSTAIPALQLADVLGGFYAAFKILAAWIGHLQDPKPLHLKVSVVEALELMSDYLKDESSLGLLPVLTGGLARYRIYFTKDRQRIAVAALEPKFFQNLLAAMKVQLSGNEGEGEIADLLSKSFELKTAEEWRGIFHNVDACISFIPSRDEVLRRS